MKLENISKKLDKIDFLNSLFNLAPSRINLLCALGDGWDEVACSTCGHLYRSSYVEEIERTKVVHKLRKFTNFEYKLG